MADALRAEGAPGDRDDVERGPPEWLVDRQNPLRGLGHAGCRARSRASRAAVRTRSRVASRSGPAEGMSAPAARTCPPPPKRAMSAAASTEGAAAEVRQDTF